MKSKITVLSFVLILAAGFLLLIILPDKDISYSERRRLKQFPELSAHTVFDGNFSSELESYLLDQFPGRDELRSVKAVMKFNILRQKDNNGIFVHNGGVYKTEYPLNTQSLSLFAQKLNQLRQTHFADNSVYLAVIPDKSMYVARENGYLSIDYGELTNSLKQNLDGIEVIELYDSLSGEDYYATDIHWRQEKIGGVAETISNAMGFKLGNEQWETRSYYPFYGSYYGQSALNITPDTLYYLVNSATENAYVSNIQQPEFFSVYDTDRLGGIDSYDVFLSGATALTVITNPISASDRELVIFRDSFASSLAPLFVSEFKTITLVDLRYMSSALLGQYVDFSGKDILFLYGIQTINNSFMLK